MVKSALMSHAAKVSEIGTIGQGVNASLASEHLATVRRVAIGRSESLGATSDSRETRPVAGIARATAGIAEATAGIVVRAEILAIVRPVANPSL
jgi:hypothetical protein